MSDREPQLVIRAAMPRRLKMLLGAVAATLLVCGYAAFEYGRSRAGYDLIGANTEIGALNRQIDTLRKDNQALRGQLAAGETERVSRSRERVEVARTIGELQAQISRQTQELAFYKGLVTQGANNDDVNIQRVRAVKGAVPQRYQLKITLVRPVQTENLATGVALVRVEGQRGGVPVRLDLSQISNPKIKDLPFSFRYVENLDTELTLPIDFQPERVTVEVRSTRKGASPLARTVEWTPEAT
jgi:outer membrane murein-binding lipoprotein Lpp